MAQAMGPKKYDLLVGADDSTDDGTRAFSNSHTPVQFSQVGVVGHVSHDGSEHVTDEVFNAASHLAGTMLSVLGTAVLVTAASAVADPWAIVAFSLYGMGLILLFGASFAHHGLKGPARLQHALRLIDYVAIYILIPATATPLCLVCLHTTYIGWVFFGSCWGLSLFGIGLQVFCQGSLALPTWASMTMFMTLGWFGLFIAIPASKCLGPGGVALLAAGGVVYTAGGAVFTLQRPNPVPGRFGFHEIWHIFVLVGAILHWAMMFFFVLPIA